MASPVFKKRFARRKTTHRPFTFARNFETDGASSPTQNQVVSQIGDRGLVITSPIQLSMSRDGLNIGDIVRKSSVPVLIAHSPPNDKQKESPEHEEEEEEADTSQRRRSFRSREPSEQFLNRRQYPHGTPQIAKVHHIPDEHYIGSKNNSNIDAEVSFSDDGGKRRQGRKSATGSSSRSSKQRARLRTSQKSEHLDISVLGETQTHGTHQPEGSSSSTRGALAKRGSERKETTISARTSSSKKRRGQSVLDQTPSPLPSVQEDATSSSDETKKSSTKIDSSVSSFKRSRNESVLFSSAKSKKSEVKNKTPLSSLSKRNEAENVSLRSARNKRSASKNKSPPPSLSKSRKVRTSDLRTTDKTLPHGNKSMSFSQENQDTLVHSGNGDLKSRVNKSRLLSPQNKDQTCLIEGQTKSQSQENKETTLSPSSVRKPTNRSFISKSSRKGSNQSQLDTSASSASRHDNTSMVPELTRKRKASVAEVPCFLNTSTGLSPIKETERSKAQKVDLNGNSSGSDAKSKSVKDSLLVRSTASRRRKRSLDDSTSNKTHSPSPEKRTRNSRLQETVTNISQNLSVRQESYLSGVSNTRSRREQSLLETSNSQSTQRNKRKLSQPNNSKAVGSILDDRDSQAGLKVHSSTSRPKIKSTLERSGKPNVSSHGSSKIHKKLDETADVKASPKKRIFKSSNSFWKTSRGIDSSLKPKRQQRAVSESLAYDDNFGEEEMDSVAAAQKKVGKGTYCMHLDQRRSDKLSEEEEQKKPRPVVTELGVIVNMLKDTEMEIMEDSVMSRPCQKIVHKAFTFTKKQLEETESQLNQIAELTYQVNKLKSVCKDLSSESKENHHQKFLLQKELQSLQSRGIDGDMMRIDQWLQDFQALRQCAR